MNQRTLGIVLAAVAVILLILNFTVLDQGTVFLVLAVVVGLVAAYLLARREA